jgi:hypothetical protein
MERKTLIAASLAIVLIFTVAPAAAAYKTGNVIIVVFDGVRQEEMFEDASHSNIPILWNVLAPQGTLYTNVRNGNDYTNTTPGHSTILTGTYEPGQVNGVRPVDPTLFEIFRKQTGTEKNKTWLVAQKWQNPEEAVYSTNPDYGKEYGPGILRNSIGKNDNQTLRHLKMVMKNYHPRLVLVNLGWTDEAAHHRTMNAYLKAIRNSDRIAGVVWKQIQGDPSYANRTTLILTSDHGRGLTHWWSHKNRDEGCRHIWALVIGPDTPAGVMYGEQVDMRQIEPTAAALLGVENPAGLMDPLPGAVTPGWMPSSFMQLYPTGSPLHLRPVLHSSGYGITFF